MAKAQQDIERVKNIALRYRFVRRIAAVQMIDMRPALRLRQPTQLEPAQSVIHNRRVLCACSLTDYLRRKRKSPEIRSNRGRRMVTIPEYFFGIEQRGQHSGSTIEANVEKHA